MWPAKAQAERRGWEVWAGRREVRCRQAGRRAPLLSWAEEFTQCHLRIQGEVLL